MCVIIDANKLSLAFSANPDDDVKPILEWILLGDGVLAYDNKLLQEIKRVGAAMRTLVELKRANKALEYPVAGCPGDIRDCLTSNDEHVVSLALTSGARVLFTDDQALSNDFRNKSVISSPRGKVYRRKEHRPLLRHHPSCKAARGKRSTGE
jgi:hypothetical protein